MLPQNTTQRVSFDAAESALDVICRNPECGERISNFADKCLPVSKLTHAIS